MEGSHHCLHHSSLVSNLTNKDFFKGIIIGQVMCWFNISWTSWNQSRLDQWSEAWNYIFVANWFQSWARFNKSLDWWLLVKNWNLKFPSFSRSFGGSKVVKQSLAPLHVIELTTRFLTHFTFHNYELWLRTYGLASYGSLDPHTKQERVSIAPNA